MEREKQRRDGLVNERQLGLKERIYVEDDNLNLSQPYIIDNDTQHQQFHSAAQQPIQQLPLQPPLYRTSINQLISQPAHDNIYSMQNIYQSLYQLSDYLWNKKLYNKYGGSKEGENNNGMGENIMEVSFDEYLLPIQEELMTYQRFRRNRQREMERIEGVVNVQKRVMVNNINRSDKTTTINKIPPPTTASLQSELIKCYQQVPFIYFQQHFTLDFGNFHTLNTNLKFTNTQQMRDQQQKMNDQLDLIEINLFGQIHRKFQDYFKAAANFDYLQDSICVQLRRLKDARDRVHRVKVEFVEKSQKLRRKIVERNNYQKTLKKLKLMRSLKKLPQIIQTILSSSLPYQCLQLLTTTRSSIFQVNSITSISSTIQNIKCSQTLVQLGLSKRYTDQLYLYVEQQVFTGIDFADQFIRISKQCRVIEDKQGNSSSLSGVLNMSGCSSNGGTTRRTEQLSNSILGSSNRGLHANNDRSGIMYLDEQHQLQQSSQMMLKNIYAKRQQAKEYQIAMILLQSYQYLDFPGEVTKIKLANGLRVVAKRFQKELVKHVKGEIAKSEHRSSSHNIQSNNSLNAIGLTPFPLAQQPLPYPDDQQSPEHIRQLLDRVSIHSYTRQIQTINQLFKQSINRYLGYVLTLVTEYEQKVHKEILGIIEKRGKKGKLTTTTMSSSSAAMMMKQVDDSSSNGNGGGSSEGEISTTTINKPLAQEQKSLQLARLQQSHTKFKSLFSQQLSILPSIFKIIEQKIKYFLSLKNMSNASPQQFYQWVGLVRYWQRWFDCFVEESVLLNYSCTYFSTNDNDNNTSSATTQLFSLGQCMITQLITTIEQNIRKSLSTMNIKSLITQLTLSYVNSYASIISAQLNQAILEESWQCVEIPLEFSDILQNILVRVNAGEGQNLSLTILNSSTTQMSFNNNHNTSVISNTLSPPSIMSKFKFKILKNNILLQGQRYKLTVSFLLLCEFIQQLIKLSRLFQTITGESDQQSIKQSKHIKFILCNIYQKIYQLMETYNVTTKQMILQKKALKMEKIKGNNIAVKHICLLSNCLTFLAKLTEHIPQQELSTIINKKDDQAETISALANHNTLLIDKISSILNKKMEQIIMSFRNKEQQKTFSLVSLLQFVTQSNHSIVTLFLQITQIIDEYLDVDKCERILKQPFQLFVQKYFKFIILKGDKFAEQARLLLQKMKFLKKYFKNQFVMMQRQVEQ